MFEVNGYIDEKTGEQKLDILIHREDDGCFAVALQDINDNLVNDIGGGKVEMYIYDRDRYYHPVIVIPMDKQTMEITLSQKETRQFYFDHDYYYTLVFTSEDGKRYTFASGDIKLIDSGRSEHYGCCEDPIVRNCGYTGRPQYW